MMKTFLIYTAIIEGLTGLGLLAVPVRIIRLLFSAELSGSLENILAMIAGAAIFSLAVFCWASRNQSAAPLAVKIMLIYNLSLTGILFYGFLSLGFRGPVLWLVIIFHLFQTLMSIIILQIKYAKNNLT